MVVEPYYYILLALAGSVAVVWTLLSMGVISKKRKMSGLADSRSLVRERNAYIKNSRVSIMETYSYLKDVPEGNRDKVRDYLDQGMLSHALESAKAYHDVYHFFKNY